LANLQVIFLPFIVPKLLGHGLLCRQR
jgi:hypothetical protein